MIDRSKTPDPIESLSDLVKESLKIEEAEDRSGIDLSDLPTAWKVMAEIAGKRAEELFDPVCFIESPTTDTQVTSAYLVVHQCLTLDLDLSQCGYQGMCSVLQGN